MDIVLHSCGSLLAHFAKTPRDHCGLSKNKERTQGSLLARRQQPGRRSYVLLYVLQSPASQNRRPHLAGDARTERVFRFLFAWLVVVEMKNKKENKNSGNYVPSTVRCKIPVKCLTSCSSACCGEGRPSPSAQQRRHASRGAAHRFPGAAASA